MESAKPSLGAYESLAGLRVSPSPDGVGVGDVSAETFSLSVHRMSPLFPLGITPQGDHYVNRTRVRQHSAIGSTCLASVYCFNQSQPNGQDVTGDLRVCLTARSEAYLAAIQFYMTVSSAGLEPC